MASTRTKGLIALIVAAAVFQVFFEDVFVFLGLTGSGDQPPEWVFLVVPSVLMGILIVVLIGGAIATDDTLQ